MFLMWIKIIEKMIYSVRERRKVRRSVKCEIIYIIIIVKDVNLKFMLLFLILRVDGIYVYVC